MDRVNFVLKTIDERRLFGTSKYCKDCGGRCCQFCGCAYSPRDFHVLTHDYSFEDRVKYLIFFIKRGYVSIEHKKLYSLTGAFDPHTSFSFSLNEMISLDKLLNGEGALYLRIRNKGKPIVDFNHQLDKGEPCILWHPEKGCPLSYNKRPMGGRLLRPKMMENAHCEHIYDELSSAIEWLQYQDVLYEVYKYFIKQN